VSDELCKCSVCGTAFTVRFSYQLETEAGVKTYLCSQRCQERNLYRRATRTCSICRSDFPLLYAYQQAVVRGERLSLCSTDCRTRALEQASTRPKPQEGNGKRAHRVAVLNQKGGTAKTTTAVSVAAGLAEIGYRTLLIDMDSQGNVGVSLGVKGKGKSLYHVLVGSCSATEAAISARPRLDVILANESLATAEVKLAQMARGRDAVLIHRMRGIKAYDYVLLDCGPSISLMNQNALSFADQVLIPVSCDYLSLVGVKQILKTLRNVNDVLRHPVSIMGVLPTFYDRRNRISNEAVSTLKSYFRERVLPPIRINTRLKEAPSHGKTIFEYASSSRGAEDYRRLVRWLVARNTGVGMTAVDATRPDRGIELDEALEGEGPTMAPVGRVRRPRPTASKGNAIPLGVA
jgi:chromosome partitioning protein